MSNDRTIPRQDAPSVPLDNGWLRSVLQFPVTHQTNMYLRRNQMITQAHMHDHSLQCQHASKARDQSLKRIFLEGDMTRLYAVCVMCLAVCLTLSPLSAQVKSSAITGTVSDPTGAVVPNATVTVLNEGTAVSTETKTTEKGDYTVPYLPVGHYTLLVNAAGFKTYRKIGIVLVSATTVREDVSLMLG